LAPTAQALDSTPDLELADPKGVSADTNLLVTEAMISCTCGMPLCLDREQRVSYILGAIFSVSDTVAAEVLEITSENFRQRLARARRDLRNFMNDKCGLVNQANPCRMLRRLVENPDLRGSLPICPDADKPIRHKHPLYHSLLMGLR
jgi:hypothetical protein